MASNWRTCKIGDVFTLTPGFAFKSSDFIDHGTPVLKIKNVKAGEVVFNDLSYVADSFVQSRSNFLVQHGDILISLSGNRIDGSKDTWVGKVAQFRRNGNYLLNQRVGILRPKTDVTIDTRCSAYLLGSEQYQQLFISIATSSGGQANLSSAQVLNAEIRLPPFAEQQAIACILGALDDKIALNHRRNSGLEAIARAIFQSWFVDFAPVQAKAEGRKPAGLPPELMALFPTSFEESELGEIPKGWHIGTVGDVVEINGWTLGKRDELDEINYIEISEVMRGEVANITRYVRGEEPGRARRRLRHGDTAISTVRPDRGAYFLCLEPPTSLIASTGFAVLTARGGHWAFVHVLTTRNEFGQELGRLADGGAYPAVRPELISARPVVIPANGSVLSAFEKLTQPLFLKVEAERKESRTLAALRDTLLPKLISGELRVPDAERIVGMVV
ncbi:MAG TPA: restriction endonuclease subunit S [Pirellulales bacterium]|nr:restriction endonuclease subunit S [Pirellulales bacterium]